MATLKVNRRRAKMAIEDLDKRLAADMQRLADSVRRERILPVCRRKRLHFHSGMGRYNFYDPSKPLHQRTIDTEDAERYGLKQIFALLDLRVPWGPLCLGDFVDSVTEEDIA